MKHDNTFVPESVEETIEQLTYAPHQEPLSPDTRLVQGLQQHYHMEQRSTKRMWARLEQYIDEHDAAFEVEHREEEQADTQHAEPFTGTFTGRIQPMKVEIPSEIHSSQRKTNSRLALFAALLCTFLLVGGLVVVFQAARTGHGSSWLGASQTCAPDVKGSTGSQTSVNDLSHALYLSKPTSIEKIDARTCKALWSTTFPAQINGQFLDTSSPLVVGNTLYVIHTNRLFGLNTNDGHIRSHWSQPSMGLLGIENGLLYILSPDPTMVTVHITPTVINGPSSFQSITPGASVFAFNPADGKVEATYLAPAEGWNLPTVAHGILYYGVRTGIGTNTGIVAMRLADRQQLWQQPMDHNQVLDNLQVQNGIVYAQVMDVGNAAGSDGRVVAFDANKGNQLWETPALQTSVRTSLITSSTIYIASIGNLYAYDAHSGHMLWQKPLDANTILVNGDTLYIGYTIGQKEGATGVAALRASDGSNIWHKDIPWLEANSPLGIQNGTLYLTTNNGSNGALEALRASDGSPLWHMPINGDASMWQVIFA